MYGGMPRKKYNWKDSNIAMFGSGAERSAKQTGKQENAWKGAGTRPGIQIWRIVNFEVTHWPRDHYGYFYNGDTYIVLCTFVDPETRELLYDVHLWIGQYSTPDEYGTGKFKVDELSLLLENKPIQHREVMDHESDLFRSYFSTIRKLEGGADSGFKRDKPKEYKTRLMHFKGSGRKVEVREVPLNRQSLDDSDVFILDAGLNIIQWNGTTSNAFEKNAGREFLSKLKEERTKATTETVDAPVPDDHPFMKAIPDAPANGAQKEAKQVDTSKPSMHRVSDASGKLEFTKVEEGSLTRKKLDTNDVFVVDTTKELFVWIGHGASIDERRNALFYAHNYLMSTTHPYIPVTAFNEGSETKNFRAALK